MGRETGTRRRVAGTGGGGAGTGGAKEGGRYTCVPEMRRKAKQARARYSVAVGHREGEK